MSNLHQLKPHPKAIKDIKRVGRGPGSGTGKTSGRGHKGQKARGPGARPGFEGGQMPLIRILPKRGFTFQSKESYQVVNLEQLNKLAIAGEITPDVLKKNYLIKSSRKPVKILGTGELTKPIKVKAHAISESAKAKLQKAGGSCQLMEKN